MRTDISVEPRSSTPGNRAPGRGRPELVLIGALKIGQGLLLAVIAIGVLHLLNKSVDDEVARWMDTVHIDVDSPWVSRLLDRLSLVDSHQLRTASVGSGVYALLSLMEGIGLCLQKRWGEYFTIAVTGSFLPFEIYECGHHFTIMKGVVLLINAAVLGYLIVRVRGERGSPAPEPLVS